MAKAEGFYGSPRWSYELTDCAMPMTLDTYSNCAHQCVYCFAFFQRAVNQGADDYLHHRVKPVDVARIKRMFTDPDKHGGQFRGYIKSRMTMQWGGLSDAFDWYERKLRVSLELLRFFREIAYPVSVSTKATWYLDDPDYVACLRGATNFHWKVSIITLDAEKTKRLEAGTPSSLERFASMRRLTDLGIPTTLRFRPFIIGASEDHIEEMFQRAADAGCISVSTEFLCIERRATANHKARYRAISEAVGYDVWSFYKRNTHGGSLMRLNYELKRPYIARMQEAAAKTGLRLFVSDAHHKEASAGGACCGLPEGGCFATYHRGQFSEAMQIAKREGKVRWSDIASDAAWLAAIPYVSAASYNNAGSKQRSKFAGKNMLDFVRHTWNTPRLAQSPARYFGGVLVPAELDEAGDIVYYYNRPLVDEGRHITSVSELTGGDA